MSREATIARIVGAWQEQREAGVFQDPEEVIAAHPDLEQELRAHFLAAQAIEQAYAETRFLRGDTPRRIGDYEIVREIGRGGMGIVYEAFQTSMRRRVALKVLFPAVTHSKRAVRRFQREARTAGRLQHTNIVPVYALGNEGGVWFYAMELIEGSSLSQVLQAFRGIGDAPGSGHETILSGQVLDADSADSDDSADAVADEVPSSEAEVTGSALDAGPTYYRRVASMFAEVADALASAHTEGVIHRDVKPSNLMLDRQGRLKLLDFGLARMIDGSGGMTVTGEVLGTPVYMSPEQARARTDEIDHRTDVYSLGATLYEMLTLRPPFAGGEFAEVYRQILTTDPDSPRTRNEQIPKDLETIVLKAMEKEPSSRYADAADLAQDLRAFADGRSIGARRVGLIEKAWRKARRHKALTTVGGLLLLALGTGGLLAHRASVEEERRIDLEYEALLRSAAESRPREGQFRLTEDASATEAAIDRAIELRPGRLDAYLLRALIAGRTTDGILQAIQGARKRGLASDTAQRLEAVVLWAGGRLEEARRRDADLASTAPRDDPLDLLVRGQRAGQRGNPERSIHLLSLAMARVAPSAALAHVIRVERAALFQDMGRDEDALADLHALQAGGDRSVQTTAQIASAWRRLGQESKAEAVIDALIKRSLRTRQTASTLALAAHGLGHHDWVARAARRGVEAWPEDAFLHAILAHAVAAGNGGDLTHTADRHWEARRLLDRALELAPDDPFVLVQSATNHAHRRTEAALRDLDRALHLAPEMIMAHRARAHVLHQAGRYAEAVDAAARALRLHPGSISARRLRAESLLELGRIEEALEEYGSAIRLNPRAPHTWWGLGLAQERVGRVEEAAESYLRAAELDPQDVTYQLRLGNMYEKGGDYEAAERHLRKALSLSPSLADAAVGLVRVLSAAGRQAERSAVPALVDAGLASQVDHPSAWACRGLVRAELGHVEASLEALDEGIRRFPRDLELRTARAHALFGLERTAAALCAYDELLAIEDFAERVNHTHLSRVWLHKGHCHESLGQADEALHAYRLAGTADPTSRDADTALSNLLFSLDRGGEAHAACERIVARIDPQADDPALLSNRGVCLFRLGRMDEAREAVERALARKPEHTEALLTLGDVAYSQGDWSTAARAFDRGLRIDPERPKVWRLLGQARVRLEEFGEAAIAFRRAIALWPDLPDLYLQLGDAEARGGRFAEAAAAVADGVRRRPSYMPGWKMRVGNLHQAGLHDEAIAVLRRAIERFPRERDFRNDLAVILLRLDRYTDAREAFLQLVELDPSYTWGWVDLAAVHRRLGQFEQSLAAYDKAIGLDASDVRFRVARAGILSDLGRYAEAAAAYSALLDGAPDSAPALNGYAWFLTTCDDATHRDPVRAVGLADRALAIEPDAPWIWGTAGWARLGTGRPLSEAVAAFERSLELGGGAASHYGLALAAVRAGRREEARRCIERGDAWLKEHPGGESLANLRMLAVDALESGEGE